MWETIEAISVTIGGTLLALSFLFRELSLGIPYKRYIMYLIWGILGWGLLLFFLLYHYVSVS